MVPRASSAIGGTGFVDRVVSQFPCQRQLDFFKKIAVVGVFIFVPGSFFFVFFYIAILLFFADLFIIIFMLT